MKRMTPEERDQAEREIARLQKMLKRDRDEEDRVRQEKTREREQEAKEREAALRERLDRLGVGDLVATGVHNCKWDGDGGHPEVYAHLEGTRSVQGGTEAALARLLDRLEALAAGRGAGAALATSSPA